MTKTVDSNLNIINTAMCARSHMELDVGDEGVFNCNGNLVIGRVQKVLWMYFRENINIYRIDSIIVISHYGLEGTEEELIEFKKRKEKKRQLHLKL